jgi:hypothetical protein
VDLETLHALLEHGDGNDRAFVDAMVRMGWSRTGDARARAELGELYAAVRTASLRSHEALRTKIAAGTLRGAELRKHFDDVPMLERDHFVEEVLGIAYPPLDEPELGRELVAYTPSGYDEIVHAFDATGLGHGDRFLDIGSGAGKAVMLAALLGHASSSGIECTGPLHEMAENASRALRVDGTRFANADVRDAALDEADVVFMYVPFTGSVLSAVMARLIDHGRRWPARSRGRFLCAAPLDLPRYRDFAVAGQPKSWLHVYAWRWPQD